MRYIKVFAPGTVANLGCGFDIMGLTLDGVGDRFEVATEAGASGLAIRNREREGDFPKNPRTMSLPRPSRPCSKRTESPCGSKSRFSKR